MIMNLISKPQHDSGKGKIHIAPQRVEGFFPPYELNIVGIRSRNVLPDRFDDEIHVFYKAKPFLWDYHIFRATTDPGTFWLKNPMYPKGTAILAQGQYRDAYQIGLHQGKYKALVQVKPVKILRDYDRDAKLVHYWTFLT